MLRELITREMQIKTIMHIELYSDLTPVRIAIIKKKSLNSKCWGGCGEKATLLNCWWERKLVPPLSKTIWRFLKQLNKELPYDLTLGHISGENHNSQRYKYPRVHSSSVDSNQDMN